MAAIATAQAGNWSATATWTGGVVPGDLDTAAINHAVTVDVNTTIGDAPDPRAIVLTVAATLTIANAVTLIVKGEISYANAKIVVGAGSILRIQVDVATTYRHIISSANSQLGAVLECNGTAGARATVDYTGIGSAAIVHGGFTGGGRVFAEFTDLTLSNWDYRSQSSASWHMKLNDCIVICADGIIDDTTNMGSATQWEWRRSKLKGVTSSEAIRINAPSYDGVGIRIFETAVIEAGTLRFVGNAGFQITGDSVLTRVLGTQGIPTFEDSFVYSNNTTDPVTSGGTMRRCVVIVGTGNPTNPHLFGAGSGGGTITLEDCIWGYLGTANNGDIILQGSPSTAQIIEALGNIFLAAANGQPTGSWFNVVNTNLNTTWRTRKNSGVTGSGGHGFLFETAGKAAIVEYFRDNLGVARQLGGVLVKSLTAITDAAITAADHNSIWDHDGEQAVTDPYEPADSKFGTPPGTDDVYVNPGFVGDVIQCGLWSWAESLGLTDGEVDPTIKKQNLAAAAIIEMQKRHEPGWDSRFTPSAFWTYVREQWAPTQPDIATGASDGTAIGAIESAVFDGGTIGIGPFLSVPLTGSAVAGGVEPVAAKWHRGASKGFAPGAGTEIAGETNALAATDTGADPVGPHYYKRELTDSDSPPVTVFSNEIEFIPPQLGGASGGAVSRSRN